MNERPPLPRLQRFLAELKRRKVFQVTSVYLVAAWGLSAGGAEIFPTLGAPEWSVRYFVIALFAATPVVILIAWLYEYSDRGIERDFGPKKLSEQETVLANARQVPVITARWQHQEMRFVTDFDIGRDEACGMQLVDPMISRRHARIEFDGEHWQLQDLGSANGTLVNGQPVRTVRLESGAVISFYPGGPPLTIDIALPQSAQTTIMAQDG